MRLERPTLRFVPCLILAAAAPLALQGCTFGSVVRGSNMYPMYDRALGYARQVSPELQADLESLAARNTYNDATHKVVACLEGYADGLRWRRQSERGDLMTEEGLKQSVYARWGTVPDADLNRYNPDLAGLKEPERRWSRAMQWCVERCVAVNDTGQSLPEDVALAEKYAALCHEQLAAAAPRVAWRQEQELAERNQQNDAVYAKLATEALDNTEKQRHLELALALEAGERFALSVHDAMLRTPLVERIAVIRQRNAAVLAKVQAYRLDAEQARLSHQLESLQRDLAILSGDLAATERAVAASSEQTYRDRHGFAIGYSRGDPAAKADHEEQHRQRTLKKLELQAEEGRLKEALRAVQQRFGLTD